MVHVVALAVSAGVGMFELAAPCTIFGRGRAELAGVQWYSFRVCAPGPVQVDDWFRVTTTYTYADLVTANTVIVPTCHDADLRPPADLVAAVAAAHANGARVVSICTGAFVLAEAGLLKGRRATTHWLHTATLQRRFPDVIVDPGVLYVDGGDVLTSAGKSAGTDLCLHLVRTDHGAKTANAIARRLVTPPHRDGGQAQYISAPYAEADDWLRDSLAWAERHLIDPITVGDLARHAGVTTRTLNRHFQGRLGTSPLRWLRHQRLLRAQELLETTDHTVDRVAKLSGFAGAPSLRREFDITLHTTPDAYRRTWSTMARSERPVDAIATDTQSSLRSRADRRSRRRPSVANEGHDTPPRPAQ